MIVTYVPSGDDVDVMSLRRWPFTETRLLGSLLLVDRISRFYEFPVVDSDSNSLLGVPKAPYNFSNRRPKTSTLVTKSKRLLQHPPFASLARSIAVFANVVNLFRGRKLLLAAPGIGLFPLMSGGSLVGMFPNDYTLLRRGDKEANYFPWRGCLPDCLVENPWCLTCYLHGISIEI